MRNSISSWKALPPDHKDYVFIYIWGFLWTVVYTVFVPLATLSLLSRFTILLWCVTAGVGALIALLGLLTRNNLITERLGVTLLMTVPIFYTVTQLGLMIESAINPSTELVDPTSRLYLIVLGMWVFFFLNKRRRQLKRQVDIAKNTPLESESQRLPE